MKKFITFYLFTSLIIILLIPLVMINDYIQKINTNKIPEIKEEIKEPEVIVPKELFSDYYKEAEEIMSNLTIEEKLAQMFIVPYSSFKEEDNYMTVGGFILSSSDIKNISKEQLIAKLSERQDKAKIKYIMTVDEEGGTVTRLSYNSNLINEKILSPRTYYNEGGIDKILEVEEMKDKILLELGFNLNLAPVADIATNPNDFMYDRSIGLNPADTGNYVVAVTKKAQELNFSTCLKHFPGYGANGDSHRKQTVDERKLEELENNDLIPFKMGIEVGTPGILVSHNLIVNIDSEYPASLSKKVIDILKNELNYSGLVISDDLTMDAVSDYNTNNELSPLAINAGNDLLITAKYKTHYNSALEAVRNGKIDEKRIDEAVRKIIAWKLAYNIIK